MAEEATVVVRLDFSDEAAWEAVCREMMAPDDNDFEANLKFVSDPSFSGEDVKGLMQRFSGSSSFIFAVDGATFSQDGHPVLVIDLEEEPGRSFRVVTKEVPSVENNLSIANMDFGDFAESAGADGVFRGFEDDG